MSESTNPLDDLLKLYAKTSQGVWCYMDDDQFFGQIRVVDDDGKFELIAETPEHDDQSDNMKFACEAHNAIPDIAVRSRRLESRLTLLEGLLRKIRDFCVQWGLYSDWVKEIDAALEQKGDGSRE